MAGVAVALAGCSGAAPPDGPRRAPPVVVPAGAVTVRVDDTSCRVTMPHAPAGPITFTIDNGGSRVTGFALSDVDGRILAEADDIGPGLGRRIVVDVADGGIYTTTCRPGMVGDGIRAPFTVTPTAVPPVRPGDLTGAVPAYLRYASAQVDALAVVTAELTADVKAGDVEAAKAVFPVAHAS